MSAGKRTGYASLPLHGGKAPPWLFSRMVLLSREILTHVCGAVKESLRETGPEWGLFAAGGKGAASPAAVQEGYQLYHHVFLCTSSGDWSGDVRRASAELASLPPDTTRLAALQGS